MDVKVHINYEAEISELIHRYSSFAFLKNASFPRDYAHTWVTNDGYWKYVNKTTYCLQVMFIGKTGYGKSTTLNKLVGSEVFETNDVAVCTKDLYTCMYRIDKKIPAFLMLSDLPGIGESNYADVHYYDWYKNMLEYSQVVVYLLRADQRDFSVDEVLFKTMFQNGSEREKVIIALNYADKMEPLNTTGGLSKEQVYNLRRKKTDVAKIFDYPYKDIIFYSARDGFKINELAKRIAKRLKDGIS